MGNLDIHVIAAAMTVTILLLAASHGANAAVSCNQVTSAINPCLSYARTGLGNPSDQCCDGVRTLNSMATTSEDRQAVCTCLKNLMAGTHFNDNAVSSLPDKCSVNLPYTISTSTDCSSL